MLVETTFLYNGMVYVSNSNSGDLGWDQWGQNSGKLQKWKAVLYRIFRMNTNWFQLDSFTYFDQKFDKKDKTVV